MQLILNTFELAGYEIHTGKTQTHLGLINTASKGIDGILAQKHLETGGILCNAVSLPTASQVVPQGIRLGSMVCTTLGYTKSDIETIAQLAAEQAENPSMQTKNDVEEIVSPYMNKYLEGTVGSHGYYV